MYGQKVSSEPGAIHKNTELRRTVNEHIGELWASKATRDKEALKRQALSNRAAFEALLGALSAVEPSAYDISRDPLGLTQWAPKAFRATQDHPLSIENPQNATADDLSKVVTLIIDQFIHLIENCGLAKELYAGRRPRHESTAQRLFFAVSYSYCKANNLDISPEIDTGTGKIDFKFSKGFSARVLVEIKLSTNSRIPSGYEKQLEDYKKAQETVNAFYIVIDVGRLGRKEERLDEIRRSARERGDQLSELIIVDGTIRVAPSKR